MPVSPAISCAYPTDYEAPKKSVLVLSCVDCRLLDDLIHFLDHDNLTNRYYHVAFAGAALGVVPGTPSVPNPFPHWRQVFIDHVSATIKLTEGKLSDIYVIQHQDCGAFKLAFDGFEDWNEQAQRARNSEYAEALLDDIVSNFCSLYNPNGDPKKGNADGKVQKRKPAVHTFYMDMRGNVELIRTWPTDKEIKAGAERECANYTCQCPKPLVTIAENSPPPPPATPKATKPKKPKK